MNNPRLQPGALVDIGTHKLGHQRYRYSRCVTCETDYPHLNAFSGLASCNGHLIGRCPWCREDSEPWTNGRGL